MRYGSSKQWVSPVAANPEFNVAPIRWALCCVLILFYIFRSVTASASTDEFNNRITLTENKGSYALGLHLAILEDPSEGLTIGDVSSSAYATKFEPSQKATPSFGFNPSAYWTRIEIVQKADREKGWMLEFGYTPMRSVDVYTRTQGGQWHHQRGGSGVPLDERPYAHHKHVFELNLPSEKVTELFIRVDGDGSKTLPLHLYRPDAFTHASIREITVLSLYAGIIIALFCYNFFIFYSIREPAYLFYVIFLAAFLMITMSIRGVSQILLVPDNPELAVRLIPFSIGMAAIFGCLFTMAFLNTRTNLHRLHWLLRAIMLWGIIASLLPWIVSYRVSVVASTALAMSFSVALFTIACVAVSRGIHVARYYLLAWCLMLFGTVLNVLRLLGVLPTNLITEYSFIWGSAAEAILLSVALAARMRLMKEEKEAAQQLALENQQKALDNLHLMDEIKDEFL
ncbi:MAG: 7TM diverse intracellular signaling domain-containing protein, partial [Ketobacteraceae bacterium]|nr:7TM diverse intracellular signaling domain-containing protein [Ketobacteraceae bacterium]